MSERRDLEVIADLVPAGSRVLDPTADLTLTTYALLRLDLEALCAVDWHTVVLDEAFVQKHVGDLAKNTDLSKFIL